MKGKSLKKKIDDLNQPTVKNPQVDINLENVDTLPQNIEGDLHVPTASAGLPLAEPITDTQRTEPILKPIPIVESKIKDEEDRKASDSVIESDNLFKGQWDDNLEIPDKPALLEEPTSMDI